MSAIATTIFTIYNATNILSIETAHRSTNSATHYTAHYTANITASTFTTFSQTSLEAIHIFNDTAIYATITATEIAAVLSTSYEIELPTNNPAF